MKISVLKRRREYRNKRELAEIARFCQENEVIEIFSGIELR